MACTNCGCSSAASASSTMFKGDHRTFQLTVQDQDGNPVDLTGASIIFTVKSFAQDTSALIQKSSANAGEIDITTPLDGEAEINLLPADTDSLEAGSYVFDIQLTTAAGKVHTLLTGNLELLQDVTN